ncbi:MAG: GNAT family N-acetyltransferase, partial [Actinomycetota bacterium]|nr:GNAT family N-acetyltransferase [Actinomycetota bacterium]
TTPYGYGGPVGRAGNPPDERFYELYRAWCAERAVVTTFVRYHPLFENWRSAPPEVVLERLADTASWPLAGADLLADVHAMHRRGARKAERVGVEVSVVVAPPRLADFVSLYEDSMRRRSAETFYLFPPAYWETLARLDERLVRLDARLDGELVASLLLLATPPWLHYHLGAASVSGFAVGASKLLFVEAARWGRRHGFAELHLGSGLGGRRDSLWEFKQRFSPHGGRQFWIGKLVHDADAYRELTGDGAVDGFFPRYRALAR